MNKKFFSFLLTAVCCLMGTTAWAQAYQQDEPVMGEITSPTVQGGASYIITDIPYTPDVVSNNVAARKAAHMAAADATNVAEINGTPYATLALAVAAANSGDVITMIADEVMTADIYIDKTVTIDLAGHTICAASTWKSTNNEQALFVVKRGGGNLTFNDSSTGKTGAVKSFTADDQKVASLYAAVKLTTKYDSYQNNATAVIAAADSARLTINGGTFTGDWYAITGNGTRPGTVITINGGTFIGIAEQSTTSADDASLAIYHPQMGTMTVNGGTFIGYASAIEMRSGTLNINSGNFTAQCPVYLYNKNGNGSTTLGAAIAVAQHTTKNDIDIHIKGGKFTGVYAFSETNPQGNTNPDVLVEGIYGLFNGKIAITDYTKCLKGGYFIEAPEASYIADDYKACAAKASDGTVIYTYKLAVPVASITDNGTTTYYASLREAVDGAVSGQTIKLECNQYLINNVYLYQGKNITVDMNGKDIYCQKGTSTAYFYFYGIEAYSYQGGKLNLTGNGTIHAGDMPFQFYGNTATSSNYPCELVIGENVSVEGGQYTIGMWNLNNGKNGEGCYNVKVDIYGKFKSKEPIYVSGNIKGQEENAPIINIHDGAVIENQEGQEIYLAGYARTTIGEATITSDKNCVSIAAGELTVNGATMTGGTTFSYDAGGGGSITFDQSSAIFMKQHTTNLPVKVKVNDGTFYAALPINQVTGQSKTPKPELLSLAINGGNFKGTFEQGRDSVIHSADLTGFIQGGHFSHYFPVEYIKSGMGLVACTQTTPNVTIAGVEKAHNQYFPYTIGKVNEGTSSEGHYDVDLYPGSSSVEAKTPVTVENWETNLATNYNAVGVITSNVQNSAFAKSTKNIIVKNAATGACICPDFELTDLTQKEDQGDNWANTKFYSPNNFKAQKVSFNRHLYSGYNSVCVPFTVTSSILPTGATMLTFNGYDKNAQKVYFDAVNTVAAGQPFFVKLSADADWEVSLTQEQIVKEPVNASNFQGSFVLTHYTQSQGFWGLNDNDEFAPIEGDVYPFRACIYLGVQTKADGSAAAPRLVVLDTETATGLNQLNQNAENEKFFQNGKLMIRHNGQIFNAAGQLMK